MNILQASNHLNDYLTRKLSNKCRFIVASTGGNDKLDHLVVYLAEDTEGIPDEYLGYEVVTKFFGE